MHMAVKTMKRAAPQTESRPGFLLLKLTVIIEKDGDSWHAFCPAFKGLHVDGDTEEKALQHAIEAAKVYINSLVTHGEPLPVGPDCSVDEGEQIPTVPPGALLRHVELQWPSHSRYGIS